MGWTAPGPETVNHKLIYVKLENKLCVLQSISHSLSATKEQELTSISFSVWPAVRIYPQICALTLLLKQKGAR